MSALKENIIAVKESADIADYIDSFGVPLKSGNPLMGTCPFHQDSTPSFAVYPSSQTYYCFGCQESGDIITFAQKMGAAPDVVEAVRVIAGQYNVTLKDDDDEHNSFDYQGVRAVLEDTHTFFRYSYRQLDDAHPAKRMVADRKLQQAPVFGYAPAGFTTLWDALRSRGHTERNILDSGVCGRTKDGRVYGFWRNRLMFTIFSASGAVTGFSGRKLDENDRGGKYVNSRATPVFDKRRNLYTGDVARARAMAQETQVAYVVEGQFDVVSLCASGLMNTFAPSGTAFTREQGDLLRRYVTDAGRVVFCFDGDSAGVKAAQHVLESGHGNAASSYVVELPEGNDPSDMFVQHGPTVLKEYVSSRQVPLVSFVIGKIAEQHDVSTVAGQESFVAQCAQAVKNITSMVAYRAAVAEIALMGRVDVDVVKQVCDAARSLKRSHPSPAPRPAAGEVVPQAGSEKDKVIANKIARDPLYKTAASYLRMLSTVPELHADVSPGDVPKDLRALAEEISASSGVLLPEKSQLPLCADIVYGSGGTVFRPEPPGQDVEDVRSRAAYLRQRVQSLLDRRVKQREINHNVAVLKMDSSLTALEKVTN